MRRVLLFSFASTLGAAFSASAARADDAPRRVRATASVEVLDDTRHVDDIISRMKAASAAAKAQAGAGEPGLDNVGTANTAKTPSTPAARDPAHRLERPALPSALPDEGRGRGERNERTTPSHHDRRTEREVHKEVAPAHYHRR